MENEKQLEKRGFFTGASPRMIFLFGLLTGLAVFAVTAFIFTGTLLIKERKAIGSLVGQTKETTAAQENEPAAAPKGPAIVNTLGTFFETDRSLCKDGKKPIIYMFSTSWCPHCKWSKPAFEKAVEDYVKAGKIVAYNWELDTNDNTLTSAKETEVPDKDLKIYEEFNPQGSIPTFVFGCKYFRIGNGHERENDLAAEEKELKDIIEKLLKL